MASAFSLYFFFNRYLFIVCLQGSAHITCMPGPVRRWNYPVPLCLGMSSIPRWVSISLAFYTASKLNSFIISKSLCMPCPMCCEIAMQYSCECTSNFIKNALIKNTVITSNIFVTIFQHQNAMSATRLFTVRRTSLRMTIKSFLWHRVSPALLVTHCQRCTHLCSGRAVFHGGSPQLLIGWLLPLFFWR